MLWTSTNQRDARDVVGEVSEKGEAVSERPADFGAVDAARSADAVAQHAQGASPIFGGVPVPSMNGPQRKLEDELWAANLYVDELVDL